MTTKPEATSDFAKAQLASAMKAIEAGGIGRDGDKKTKGGIAAYSTGRGGDIMNLSPYAISIKEDWNIRDPENPKNHENILWLAKDIMRRGVTRPLTVYLNRADQKVYVSDGHCRLMAVWYANDHLGGKIEVIPVMTTQQPTDALDRMAQTFISNSGLRPSQLEKVMQVRKMMGASGQGVDVIADRIGEETSTVMDWLKNDAMLSPQIRKLIAQDLVSFTFAVKCIEEHNFDDRKALAEITRMIEKNEGKKIRPKNLVAERTGFTKLPALKTGLRTMLNDNTITVTPIGERVQLEMAAEDFEKVKAMLGIKPEGTIEGAAATSQAEGEADATANDQTAENENAEQIETAAAETVSQGAAPTLEEPTKPAKTASKPASKPTTKTAAPTPQTKKPYVGEQVAAE
jgi:hypothetical protein